MADTDIVVRQLDPNQVITVSSEDFQGCLVLVHADDIVDGKTPLAAALYVGKDFVDPGGLTSVSFETPDGHPTYLAFLPEGYITPKGQIEVAIGSLIKGANPPGDPPVIVK